MDKYDFIGEIKFYDYRVNHFGFLIVYNPTSIFYHDSLRITKDSFVNIPSSNSDKSLIFFNIDRETKVPKDVVLIDSLIPENDFLNDREPDFTELQNVAKNILEKINFSELESVCSKLKISVKDKIQKIVNILPMLNIDQQYVRKYYNIIEKYYLIDDSLLYFFNNDKDHFRKIILSDTYNIADLNDQQRIFYIKQIDDIKIKDNLIKDWKFDDISKNFELVKYLNVNNLKSSSISDFINQLKKKFNEFNFSQQFDLADYFEDKELINKSINDWFFPNDNETIDLLNKIEEKDIDSSGLKKFTKELGSRFESFNNDLQILIINYMNDLDFFIEKISSKENDIIKNNFDFILDWMEKRSSEFIENDKIKSGLKKEILFFFNDNSISYLKEFCDRKSFFWLLNDKELMELWSFNDLNELANFSTFFFNSEISEISNEIDEKITSVLVQEVNNKSLKIAMKWYGTLNDKFITIKMLYDFTIDQANYQRALYGEKYLTLDETTVKEIFTSHFDNLDDDVKYLGLINFWDIIIGKSSIIAKGKPPDKSLMVSWFQRDDIPEPLQLIFLKALIFSIHLNDGLEKYDVAHYINEFPFTDLSAKLLMILIQNRKTTGMEEVATALNEAFYDSLNQNYENPYIGYSMKHCSKRKHYAGNIYYDSERKTYVFSDGFGLEESDNSPDQYALEFNSGITDENQNIEDDYDLPF